METRCAWVPPNNEAYVLYHERDWGVPVHDDRLLFEMLILEGAQAGLSWDTILKKRDNYRRAFFDFDIERCSKIDASDEEALLANPGIVRNRLKIGSVKTNALAVLKIREEFGSFDAYLWRFADCAPLQPAYRSIQEIPTTSELSDAISADLKKRGMKFVGSTIMQAYAQAVGLINAHTTDCFRYRPLSSP